MHGHDSSSSTPLLPSVQSTKSVRISCTYTTHTNTRPATRNEMLLFGAKEKKNQNFVPPTEFVKHEYAHRHNIINVELKCFQSKEQI